MGSSLGFTLEFLISPRISSSPITLIFLTVSFKLFCNYFFSLSLSMISLCSFLRLVICSSNWGFFDIRLKSCFCFLSYLFLCLWLINSYSISFRSLMSLIFDRCSSLILSARSRFLSVSFILFNFIIETFFFDISWTSDRWSSLSFEISRRVCLIISFYFCLYSLTLQVFSASCLAFFSWLSLDWIWIKLLWGVFAINSAWMWWP